MGARAVLNTHGIVRLGVLRCNADMVWCGTHKCTVIHGPIVIASSVLTAEARSGREPQIVSRIGLIRDPLVC